ncbi:MAG: N-acetylmuramoyl-L-alanine amidase [Muribaculum sp.]|nr:N-acetylmuramoyl-L-alanine amidase [Muribaculum sp.]
MVGPKTWSALGVVTPTNSRSINKIILHCSATPEGEDFSVEQIRQGHLARGFNDIGYHWYIGRDGTIYKGRDESKVGAHTTGYNSHSIGVCYCGGCPPRSVKNWDKQGKDTRTPAQRAAIIKLCKELKARYPGATLHGHNEFANKACPSFIVKDDPDLKKL